MAKNKKTSKFIKTSNHEILKDNRKASVVSEDSILFEEKQTQSKETKDVLKEIESAMSESVYRGNDANNTPIEDSDEGANAIVFNECYVKNDRSKAKKPKKSYEHTTWLHKMKVLGVLLVLGIFTGSGLGVWYFNYELRSNFNPNDYNMADYIQSVDYTFNKNNINATEKDGLNWVSIAQSQALTPANLTPADNFVLAQYNVTKANSYEIYGEGYVNSMKVKQSIISRKKYNGSYYTFESISPSKISLIDDIILCDKYEKNSKEVVLYTSSKTNPKKGDWKYSETLSSSDYELISGGLPNTIQAYIISEKTVDEDTNKKEQITYNSEDDTYSFTMKLDTKTSVLNYAKQMKRTGGLGGYPDFSSISFSVVIDSNWNLLSFSIKENYSAIKGIKAPCSGVLNYTITINGDVEMPV